MTIAINQQSFRAEFYHQTMLDTSPPPPPNNYARAVTVFLILLALIMLSSEIVMMALAASHAETDHQTILRLNTVRVAVVIGLIAAYGAFVLRPLRNRMRTSTAELVKEVEDRRRTEQDLIERTTFVQSIISASPNIIFVYDIDANRVTYVSRTAWEFREIPREQWTGAFGGDPLDFIVEEDHAVFRQAVDALIGGAPSHTVTVRTRLKREWVRVHLAPFEVEDGRLVRLTGVVVDVTELKQTQDELQEQKHFIEQVSSAAPEIIYVFDLDQQRAVYVNHAESGILGYPVEQFMALEAQVVPTFVHPDDVPRLKAMFEEIRTANDDAILELEVRARDASGQWQIFWSRSKVFKRDENGRAVQIIGTSRDITERRAAEKRAFDLALEREKMRLNAEFIANSSHELRTPLTIINGTAYVMSRTDEAAVRQEKLDVIETQIARINILIDDLQMMATLDSGVQPRGTIVEVNQLIREVVLSEAGMTDGTPEVQMELAEDLPPIPGDPHTLMHAFKCLLQNAVGYSPSDAVIDVSAQRIGNNAVIEVTDRGPGIAAEDLPYIFERFYKANKARTQDRSGSGLGLAMVKKITDSHGGRVEVESVTGQTTFRLLLPVKRTEAETQEVSMIPLEDDDVS